MLCPPFRGKERASVKNRHIQVPHPLQDPLAMVFFLIMDPILESVLQTPE